MSASSKQSGSSVTKLSFKDGPSPVLIETEKQDRFFSNMQQVVRDVVERESEREQHQLLVDLLSDLRKWSKQHADRLHAVYLGVRDSEINVFVVPISEQYDPELSDALSQLDLTLFKTYPFFRGMVQQIPGKNPELLASFMDRERAAVVYGP